MSFSELGNPWDDDKLSSLLPFTDLEYDLKMIKQESEQASSGTGSPNTFGGRSIESSSHQSLEMADASCDGEFGDVSYHKNTDPLVFASQTLGVKPTKFGEAASSTTTTTTKKKSQKTANKHKKSVAELSRNSREKRKREVEYLKARNRQLCQEREKFLETISSLQGDTLATRSKNEVDLMRENELLRAEVQEHKRFVRDLQRFVRDQNILKEEEQTPEVEQEVTVTKQQLLSTAASTTVEQLIGLSLTTAVNPEMKVANIDHLGLENMKLYFQNLPHGSTNKTCKRIISRCEFVFDVPLSVSVAFMSQIPKSHEALAKKYESHPESVKLLSVSEIGSLASDHGLEYPTTCEAYAHEVEYEGQSRLVVFLHGTQKRELPKRSFIREQEENELSDSPLSEPCHIFTSITDGSVDVTQFLDKEMDDKRLKMGSHCISGFVLVGYGNKTRLISITNMRREDLSPFRDCTDLYWFDDDDKPGEIISKGLKTFTELGMYMKMSMMSVN